MEGHETCVQIVVDGKVRRLDEIIREVTESVLIANDGNKEITANELGISLKTLYVWLREWGYKMRPYRKWDRFKKRQRHPLEQIAPYK